MTSSIWKTRFWQMRSSITSLTNPKIKELRKLKDKKYRMATGTFLIEGVRFIGEALRQSAKIRTLIFTEEALLRELEGVQNMASSDPAGSGSQSIRAPGESPGLDPIDLLEVTPEILKDLSSTVTPQGIIALVDIPGADPGDFQKDAGLWLYLDEIRDPGNLGTMIRTAHAFDLDGIILSKGCADPYQDKVLRSTMGSIFKTPLLTDQTAEFLRERIERGAALYLADLEEAHSLPGIRPAPCSIVVIGNEARGVSREIRALPHQSIRIPMPGGAESLNAAVAAALVLYEFKGRV